MAQHRTGTVTTTNGSNVITGNGTGWAALVVAGVIAPGHFFHLTNDAHRVPYTISWASDTIDEIHLTAPFGGPSITSSYAVTYGGWSPNAGLYMPDANDVDIVMLIKHGLVQRFDSWLGTGGAGHVVEYNSQILQQRSVLKVDGGASVADTGGKTVLTVHPHDNLTVLGDLSDAAGVLNYKGQPIQGGGGTPASAVTTLDGSPVVGTDSKFAREGHKHGLGVLYIYGLGGAVDQTGEITNALSAAISQGKTLVPVGRFTTNGGYLIDDPITIRGERATFVLTANATLFDISTNYALFDGLDIEVPDANTVAAVRITTSVDRLRGRGWGPMRKVIWRNSRIYSASAANWDQSQGYDTIGNWIGIEFLCDTTGGSAGIDFIDVEDTYIEFPATGILCTKIGTNSAWFNGNMFKNIFITGFTAGIKSITNCGFGANEFRGLFLHHLRGTDSVGIWLDGWAQDNTFTVSAWNDSGWVTTRSNFQCYHFEGSCNNIDGYTETSEATPNTGPPSTNVSLSTWTTNPGPSNGVRGSIFKVGRPVQIQSEYTSPSTANIAFISDVYGDVNRFMFRRYNGTSANPTKVLADDNMLAFGARGYTGSGFPSFSTGQVQIFAAEDQDAGYGTGIKFIVTPIGVTAQGGSVSAVTLHPSGRVLIGNPWQADDGVNLLQVNGKIKSLTGGFVFPDNTTQTTAGLAPNGNGSQLTNLPSQLPANAVGYLYNDGTTKSWSAITAGLELSRVLTGNNNAAGTDSLVEFTATGTYTLVAGMSNKKSIIISNTHASNTVTINTDGAAFFNGSPTGTYILAAGRFCILGEEPNNQDSWRVVAVGSNGGVAGTNTQLQYNNNGVMAGASLYWDEAGKLLGLGGITTPLYPVHVRGVIVAQGNGTDTGVDAYFNNGTTPPGSGVRVGYFGLGGHDGTTAYNSILLKAVTNEAWTYSTNRGADFVIETTAAGGTTRSAALTVRGDKVQLIANCSSAPASTPTGGGFFYVENGALKYKGSSGTVTTIANA